jgi:hypothetical protein
MDVIIDDLWTVAHYIDDADKCQAVAAQLAYPIGAEATYYGLKRIVI